MSEPACSVTALFPNLFSFFLLVPFFISQSSCKVSSVFPYHQVHFWFCLTHLFCQGAFSKLKCGKYSVFSCEATLRATHVCIYVFIFWNDAYFAQRRCTKLAEYVHNIHTIFAQYLHNICTIFAQYLRNICAQYLHNICTIFAQYLHNISTIFAQSLYNIYTIFAQYLYNIYTIFVQYLHNIFYDICTILVLYLYNICKIFSQYLHNISWIFAQY